jgi:hypothetical protein
LAIEALIPFGLTIIGNAVINVVFWQNFRTWQQKKGLCKSARKNLTIRLEASCQNATIWCQTIAIYLINSLCLVLD